MNTGRTMERRDSDIRSAWPRGIIAARRDLGAVRDTIEIPNYEPTPERIKNTMLAFIQQVEAMPIGIHALHGCCYLGSLADKGSKFACDLLIVAACRPCGHAPSAGYQRPCLGKSRMAAAISNADRRGLVTPRLPLGEKPTRDGVRPVSKSSTYLRLVRKKASARPLRHGTGGREC